MTIVLDKTILFHPENDRTNHFVEFVLPKDYHTLRCECSYSPKSVENKELALRSARANIGRYVPRYQQHLYTKQLAMEVHLVNLLTFSLDYEGSYLGCAHRHDFHQVHSLAKEASSPGFVRHAASAGNWRAVISVHSITSAEVAYHLTITALEEGEIL